jgi:hypothetical protein
MQVHIFTSKIMTDTEIHTELNIDFMERNLLLIRQRLLSQIDVSLEKGNKFIDKELSGPFYALVKPVVKLFYNTIKKKDMTSGTVAQIDIVLEAAKNKVYNPEKDLEEIISDYFERYVRHDQTDLSLRKSHPNYRKCRENLKNTFRAQLKPVVKLLGCMEPNISNYDELSVVAYKTKKDMMEAMCEQLKYMNIGIDIVGKDKAILDLPVGREVLFNVLKQGYAETWKELIEGVGRLFPDDPYEYDPFDSDL